MLTRRLLCELTDEVDDFVDFGLPSGLLWAKGNIVPDGAGGYKVGEETDYGAYFSWGNTDPHFSTNRIYYDNGWSFGTSNSSSPYKDYPGYELTTSIPVGDSRHDAALAILGSPWRMPSTADWFELSTNTDKKWTTINGVKGKKYMKKTDHSVYVFFPAAGYGGSLLYYRGSTGRYWTTSIYSTSTGLAYAGMISNSNTGSTLSTDRYYGCSVRGVCQREVVIRLLYYNVYKISDCHVTITDQSGNSYSGITDENGRVKFSIKSAGIYTISTPEWNIQGSNTFSVKGKYTYVLKGVNVKPVISGYIELDMTDGGTNVSQTSIIYDKDGNNYDTGYTRPAVIDAIRAASHCYVGTYDSTKQKMILKQLDDTDGTKYADGTDASADILSSGKNVFMRLPFFGMLWGEISTNRWRIYFYYTPSQTANSYYGGGGALAGGKYLIGKYEAYAEDSGNNSTGVLCSRSGVLSSCGINLSNFKLKARNNGTNFSLVTWHHNNIMAILFYAYYGHTCAVEMCGRGDRNYTGDTRTTGLKNSLGMTDTTQENGNTDNVVFWGLENWWGCKSEYVDNVSVLISRGQASFHINLPRWSSDEYGFPFAVTYNSSTSPSRLRMTGLSTAAISPTSGGSPYRGFGCIQSGPYIINAENYCILRSGNSLTTGDAYGGKKSGLVFLLVADSTGTGAMSAGSRLAYTGAMQIVL